MFLEINTIEELEDAIEYVDMNAEDSLESLEKLGLLCIQKAQEFKDIDLEFQARSAYLNAINYLHKCELVVAMFPWLLKKCDEDRERFDYEGVLWMYGWVVSSLHQFATIPKQKIEEIREDFEKRMLDFGSGEKVIDFAKFCLYSETGHLDLAQEYLDRSLKSNFRGTMDDCRHCRPTDVADFLLVKGEYGQMLELIGPVLRREVTCHRIARYAFHMGMIAAMMLGRWDEAEHYANVSAKENDLRMAVLFPASSHLIYYGVTNRFVKGRNVFEKQFPFSLRGPDLQKFEFYTGALVFFHKMKASGRKSIKLKLPENNLLYNPASSEYATDHIIDVLTVLTDQVAGALDTRNGNDFFKEYAQTIMERYQALAFRQ